MRTTLNPRQQRVVDLVVAEMNRTDENHEGPGIPQFATYAADVVRYLDSICYTDVD